MNTFRFFILLISFSISSFTCFTQKNERELKFEQFPLYEEVYTFLSREIKYPCTDYHYSLAKKPDGYYLVLQNYNEGQISDVIYQKIWDASTTKYILPDIETYLDKSGEK